MTTKTDKAPVIEAGQTFTAEFTVEVEEAKAEGDLGKVTALVSVYNVAYRMGFMTKHQIEVGAFADSLSANPIVPMFWQHNWNFTQQPPIGVGTGSESAAGLLIDGDFFLDTEAGRSVFNAMKRKALRQWSIGYRITEWSVEETDDGIDIIHVKKAELLEASSVLKGANPETDTLKVASEADVMSVVGDALSSISSFGDAVQALAELGEALSDRMDALETALADIEDALDVVAFEPGDRCAEDGCKNEATTNRPSADDPDVTETVCDEHAASSGEEGTGEPAAAEGGDGREAEAASAPAPRVPDFLPPLPADVEPSGSDTADIEAQTRVMRAWNKAVQKAESDSLIETWR